MRHTVMLLLTALALVLTCVRPPVISQPPNQQEAKPAPAAARAARNAPETDPDRWVPSEETPAPAADFLLVQDGQALATLVIQGDEPDVQLAAEELQEHIEKMTGVRLPAGAAGEGPAIVLATDPSADSDPAAFVLSVTPERVEIRGRTAQGTLNGVYELLEQLGVRWYMPGELGTVTPRASTLGLPLQRTVQNPSFSSRHLQGGLGIKGDSWRVWVRRMRAGGPLFPPCHGISLGPEGGFKDHPELYALVKGKRQSNQLCVSNPRTLELAAEQVLAYFRKNPESPWIGMGPNDAGGFCQCGGCLALDTGDRDPINGRASYTDRYVWFFNRILERVEGEFPDKKICFYAYHYYLQPPLREKPDPRIVAALAPITLCRIHGPNNPVCPEKQHYGVLLKGWGELLPELYDRGYWSNLADPGLPFPMVHRIREQIPLAHQHGITGWRVECFDHYASELPSLYLAMKLMWNHEADPDAVMKDFFGNFYGPAAPPMARALSLLDAALRDGDYHTGSSYDLPYLYPKELRLQVREHLEQARQLAGGEPYLERVAVALASLDTLDAFLEMLEQRNRHQYVEARTSLERLTQLQKSLIEHDPPLLNSRLAPQYLDRFFRPAVEEGAARVTGGNRFLAGLPDEWDFRMEAGGGGEWLGFPQGKPESGWKRLKTSSTSWGTQGHRYTTGTAWYRQTVELPPGDGPIRLWFGGVDEKAEVWVNAKLIGSSPGKAFAPFELDATGVAQPGRQNLVVVKVTNRSLDELGTGGITAPVMFYTPAGPQGGNPPRRWPWAEAFSAAARSLIS